MRRLEKSYSGRLRKTESQSLSLRKKLAPRIARLALESRSLRDFVMHGQLSQPVYLTLFRLLFDQRAFPQLLLVRMVCNSNIEGIVVAEL